METPFEYIDVIDGDFRIRCYSKHSVEQWLDYILSKGGCPKIEAKFKEVA